MVKNLLSRSRFAELAGVTPAAVTKACVKALLPAVEGKLIDADHPAAVKYIAEQARAKTLPTATGIDPFYEEAVAACVVAGNYTAEHIRITMKVGSERARQIRRQIEAAGLIPKPGEPEAEPTACIQKAPAKKESYPRGRTVEKENKKRGYNPLSLKQRGRKIAEDIVGDITRGKESAVYLGYEVPDNMEAFADMTLRELIAKFGTDIRFLDWLRSIKVIEDINEKRIKNAEAKGELVSRELVKRGVIDHIETAHVQLLTDGAKTIAQRAFSMSGAGMPIGEIEKFVRDQIASFIKPVKLRIARALATT